MQLLFLMLLGCSEQPPVQELNPDKDESIALRNTVPVNLNPPVKPKAKPIKLRIQNSDLLRPYRIRQSAPVFFTAVLSTNMGDVLIYSKRSWSPHGVDRLYGLLRISYFNQCAFFQSPASGILNFGVHALPRVSALWEKTTFKDDPVRQTNSIGALSFARTKFPHTRSVRLFVNLSDNRHFDAQGYAPVARVVSEDMGTLKRINAFIRSEKIPVPTKRELIATGLQKWLSEGDPLRIEKAYLCAAKGLPEAIQNKCASMPVGIEAQ